MASLSGPDERTDSTQQAPAGWVLQQIFVASRTETDVAGELGIRKQSVNERKCKILDAVREKLDGEGQKAAQ